MAIMRSEIKKGGGADWLGIKTGTVKSFIDESAKYEWADVYLVVEFTVEGSEYPRVCKVVGSFDKEADGQRIKDCTLLKRITFLFDALGDMGGVNQFGKWVNSDEKDIDNIVSYMNENHAGKECTIYVYKELAKNGQAYTRVHNKVLAKSASSEKELEDYITFLKSKGFIKEAPADHQNPTANGELPKDGNFDASGIDIANL